MSEDNKKVVEALYAAGNRGDLEACFGMLAEDVSWTVMGSTRFSGTYAGKQALMEELLGPLFGRLNGGIRMEVRNLIAEGDQVVAVADGRAETLEGVPYENRYCQVFTIRDGRIVAVEEFLDTAHTNAVFGAG